MAGADTGILDLPYIANEALVAGRFVKIAGAQLVDQADTVGEKVLGVCPTAVSAAEATAGKTVRVITLGVAWVRANAAITIGDEVATTAAGRAATAATGNRVAGVALKAAAAQDDLIPVLLVPFGRVV